MKKYWSIEYFLICVQIFMHTFRYLLFADTKKIVEWYELWFPTLILAFLYFFWGLVIFAKWVKSVITYKEDEYDKWAKDLRK